MKEDTFKNIIKKSLKKEPSDLLTAKIMESIAAEANEVQLKTLLKDDLIYNTSSHFTNSVLESITQEQVSVVEDYSPVISKKAWYFIVTFFVAILAFSFYSDSSLEISQLDYVTKALDFTSLKLDVFASYFASNRFVMLLITSVASLVMIDAFMKSNKFHYNKL